MYFFTSFLAGTFLFYLFGYFPFSAAFLFLGSTAYLVIRKKAVLVFVLLFGISYAFFRYEPPRDPLYVQNQITIQGVCESYPAKTDAGTFRQIFTIADARDAESGEQLNGLREKEITIFSDREFDAGKQYGLTVQLLKSRKRLNPGYQGKDDIAAILIAFADSEETKNILKAQFQNFRYRINKYIRENMQGDPGALVVSITTGDRVHMSKDLKDAFNETGLVHILSISGSHFGLFSILLFGIFRLLVLSLPYRILQRITLYFTPSQAAAVLCFPFMLFYLGLSGGSIPAVRSFIMISLFLVGLIIVRKGFWLNSLLFAACILILWQPEWLLSLSFQLSFLAVLCIGFAFRQDETKEKSDRKLIGYAKNAFVISLAASIGTAPLVAYSFHYFSVISPLSNLFIAPLIGFALIPLSVISSFLFLTTGYFVFSPLISVISDISIYLVELFARIPFAAIKIPAFPPVILLLFYAGFLCFFVFNRKKYFLVLPFLPMAIYLLVTAFERERISVTFLDVGQGDSSVIELPDGKTMVIDTGKTGWETASFLTYRGKETIDIALLSHCHPDHTGGLQYLAERFAIQEIWDNGRMLLPEGTGYRQHRSFSRGDMLEGKGYTIYFLHPYPEFYSSKGREYVTSNNDSLVIKIIGSRTAFLFTGDIAEEAEEDIMQLGKWVQSDIVKVPHHGSKASADPYFFRSVSPQVAVISVGSDNPFGHPHQSMLDILDKARIYRTDHDGAVRVSETESGFETKTFREFQFARAGSLRDEVKNCKRLFEKW